MGIEQSWKGKYHQSYVPPFTQKVITYCFHSSLRAMKIPTAVKTVSICRGKCPDFMDTPPFVSYKISHGNRVKGFVKNIRSDYIIVQNLLTGQCPCNIV